MPTFQNLLLMNSKILFDPIFSQIIPLALMSLAIFVNFLMIIGSKNRVLKDPKSSWEIRYMINRNFYGVVIYPLLLASIIPLIGFLLTWISPILYDIGHTLSRLLGLLFFFLGYQILLYCVGFRSHILGNKPTL